MMSVPHPVQNSDDRYKAAFAPDRDLTHYERFLLMQADHLEDMLIQAENQLRRAGIVPIYRPKHNQLTLANDN